MTPDEARRILALHFDPAAQARIKHLTEKLGEKGLDTDEQAELDSYQTAEQVIGTLKPKARDFLNDNGME